MNTLITVAVMLAALASPASAETQTCIGRVKITVVTDNDGLNPKGTREFSIGNGCVLETLAQQKQVLRTCPMGSFCRVTGTEGGDDTLKTTTSVKRVRR